MNGVLTTSTKSVNWKISLDPFGETVTEQNGNDNNFRFPGQYLDRESGLSYNWHRYYQPKVGRYYQVDPVTSNLLSAHSGSELYNVYTYTRNNPLRYVDPLGLWVFVKKNKTTGKGLTWDMKRIEKTVDGVFRSFTGHDAIVTFTTNGEHENVNTLHPSGNAIDLRVWGMTRSEQYQARDRLKKLLGPDYDVVVELKKPHIHVEFDPKPKK